MNTQMNLQRISVDKLKPAKYNPRKDLKPGDPAYEKNKRSLHDGVSVTREGKVIPFSEIAALMEGTDM